MNKRLPFLGAVRHPLLALLLLAAAGSPATVAAAAAPAVCRSEWTLSTRGVAIGAADDLVQVAADGATLVHSEFRPNALLAMFGVDPAQREFRIDAHGRAQQRTETRAGSRPETNLWQRRGDGQWVRSLNGVTDKQVTPEQDMVIDSTSFPYLLQLGLLAPEAGSHKVAVVAKGKVYGALLTLQVQDGGAEAYVLDFSSADGQGRAWIGRDLKPQRVEFTDEHGTLRGVAQRWDCH